MKEIFRNTLMGLLAGGPLLVMCSLTSCGHAGNGDSVQAIGRFQQLPGKPLPTMHEVSSGLKADEGFGHAHHDQSQTSFRYLFHDGNSLYVTTDRSRGNYTNRMIDLAVENPPEIAKKKMSRMIPPSDHCVLAVKVEDRAGTTKYERNFGNARRSEIR